MWWLAAVAPCWCDSCKRFTLPNVVRLVLQYGFIFWELYHAIIAAIPIQPIHAYGNLSEECWWILIHDPLPISQELIRQNLIFAGTSICLISFGRPGPRADDLSSGPLECYFLDQIQLRCGPHFSCTGWPQSIVCKFWQSGAIAQGHLCETCSFDTGIYRWLCLGQTLNITTDQKPVSLFQKVFSHCQ